MHKKLSLLLIILAAAFSSFGQTPTAAPSPAPEVGIKDRLAGGDVKKIVSAENKIEMMTKDGGIDVILSAATTYKRVSPEKPNLATASDATIADIGEGDKILVTGVVAADRKSIPAKTVYLITKSDIAKRNAAEKELWRTRGIFGRVASVDFKTQKVTIAVRGAAGETNVVLSPKENAEFLRYAPNSVKFSDVVDSNLSEIKVGDQLRALGDKSTDGLAFTAEKFVSGSFRTVAGKVTAVDTVKNEVVIEDAQTKKPLTISFTSNSVMKRFPPEMARMMAMAQAGGFGGAPGQGGNVSMRPPQGATTGTGAGAGRPAQGGQPGAQPGGQPTGQAGAGGQGQPGGGQRPGGGMGGAGRRGPGELDDMMERLPNIAVADLKIGDTIGISSTAGTDASRLTAIKLLAGVEAFLTAPQMPSMGAGRGQAPNFNIPGLDGGFGNP